MKYLRLLIVFAFVLAALGAQAERVDAMKFSYTSGYQIQNLANSAAIIDLTYYNAQTSDPASGGTALSQPVTISALGSATFFPIHATDGFKGSVVISSNTPVASIVNLVGSYQGVQIGNSSYVGLSSGATQINLPLLHKDNYGYDSWFSVQNAGALNATVNVAYSDGVNVGPVTIKPGASYTFDQMTETHPATAKVFAAKVTSDQPIVVVVVQERLTDANKLILAYTGFDGGETNAVMPLINTNNYGFITGVQVQNVGAQASNITVTYYPSKNANGQTVGTQCTETLSVAAGASTTFGLTAFDGTGKTAGTSTCVKQTFVGSAQITSNSANQPVVTIVNQATSTAAGAYGSFIPSRSTSKVVLPLIMDRNYGWYTGFNLMNVGDAPVTVTCTFTNTSYTITKNLAVGEAVNDVQNNKIGNRYVGSGTCTAVGTGSPKIAAVVNEISPDNADNLLVYEGINVTP